MVGAEQGERISGCCPTCGRGREFVFRFAEARRRAFIGEPSHLLDPGEWLSLGAASHTAARERRAAGLRTEDEVVGVHAMLMFAITAVDEALCFLSPTDVAVRPETFWSGSGRAVYELAPDRFTRSALLAARDSLEAELTEFSSTYGI